MAGYKASSERGVALIAAVMAVAVLLAIGLSFAFNMRLEEKAAVNYMYSLKAKYVAEAGIEKAVTALKVYANDYAYYYPDSIWTSDLSGLIGNDAYTVTVTDCASQIYLNDTASTTLDEMLDALSTGIDSTEASDIVNYRNSCPGSMFITKELVKGVSSMNESEYDGIKDYITVNTWVNPATNRAPVNVNTASRDVLIAVLDPLTDIDSTEAGLVADDLISNRPIETWADFNSSIDGSDTDGDITTAEATTIKDNCNPNRTEPSPNTTEFCFNSGGYFEIESTGIVYDPAGNQAAEKKIRAVVKIFDIWNHTTQAHFQADNYPDTSPGVSTTVNAGDVDLSGWEHACDNISGWTTSTASVDTNEYYQGSGSIELEGTGESACYDWSADPQTRLIAAAVWVYALDDSADGISLILSDGDPATTTNRAVDILMKRVNPGTREFRYHNGTNYNNQIGLVDWDKETWYEVQVVADVLADRFDAYINTSGVTDSTAASGTTGETMLIFRNAVDKINRITLQTVATAVTCYFDYVSINACGSIYSVDASDCEKPSGAEWGTIAWTESTPSSAYDRVFLELNDGSGWVGDQGAGDTLSSLMANNSYPLRGNLDNDSRMESLYNVSSGQVIHSDHDSSNTLKYSAILAGLNAAFTACTLYDVTITYLPDTEILYWREVTE